MTAATLQRLRLVARTQPFIANLEPVGVQRAVSRLVFGIDSVSVMRNTCYIYTFKADHLSCTAFYQDRLHQLVANRMVLVPVAD